MSSDIKTSIQREVRRVYRWAKEKRRKKKFETLQSYLKSFHEQQASIANIKDGQQIPKLPSTGNPGEGYRVLSALQEMDRGGKTRTAARTVAIEPDQPDLPKHIIYIPMQRNRCVSDTTPPTFIPYLGEDRHDESSLLTTQDIAKRRKLVEEGPACFAEETEALLDEVLKECGQLEEVNNWGEKETFIVLSAIAEEAKEMKERVQRRFVATIVPTIDDSKSKDVFLKLQSPAPEIPSSPKDRDNLETKARDISEKAEDAFDKRYLEVVDSYRAFYCRRCFTYQCNVHGLSYKQSLAFQLERSQEKEADRGWPSLGIQVDPEQQQFCDVKRLSTFQKDMCKRTYLLYDGDLKQMSIVLRASEKLLFEFIRETGITLPSAAKAPQQKKLRSKIHKYSVRHYNTNWYRAIEKAEINPFFTPCNHQEPCSERTCSCVKNRFFCTSACSWGASSPNFFRGCGCKAACNSTSCTCFAARRECDPDLCGCGPCQDPPDQAVTNQMCRNDNLRMRRHEHLLVAPSDVSGWGCFAKYDLKKGDFIHEYTGEIITQEEAEKRGQVDDAKNRSYMFNLSSDYVLDACRRGSKARFINHSDTPNCATRTVFVNGDQRICFFACEDIKAETELFFDYRYNVSMNNELIDKAAKKPDWFEGKKEMTKPKGKSSKKRKR